MPVAVYMTNKYELETLKIEIACRVEVRFVTMLVVCQVFKTS